MLTYDRIYSKVWGGDAFGDERTLSDVMKRKIIKDSGTDGRSGMIL